MIFASFASGSSGNCTFISTDTENILIDCGITAKKIEACLADLGKTGEDLDAILLTHEHIDHIRGLKKLVRTYSIPVYCSCGTWNNLSRILKDGYFETEGMNSFREVRPDEEFYIGNTLVHPFHTYHDTPGPLGFRFEMEEQIIGKDVNLAVVTDCGSYDDYICRNLRDLDALLIESNHDVEMLMEGPYPMFLKRRILSDMGHSSNENCGRTIRKIWTPRLKSVVLAHLSEENNTPEKALCSVCREAAVPGLDIRVAPRDGLGKVIGF